MTSNLGNNFLLCTNKKKLNEAEMRVQDELKPQLCDFILKSLALVFFPEKPNEQTNWAVSI